MDVSMKGYIFQRAKPGTNQYNSFGIATGTTYQISANFLGHHGNGRDVQVEI